MKRGVWIAAAVLLAGPAAARTDQGPAAGTKAAATGAKPATAGAKPATAGAKPATAGAKPATAGAKGAEEPELSPARRKLLEKRGLKATAPEDRASAAARSRVRRTKSVFMYAAESCERAGDRCDPSLRDDAEARFMEACGACAPFERCDAERVAIRGGNARSSSDLCAAPR